MADTGGRVQSARSPVPARRQITGLRHHIASSLRTRLLILLLLGFAAVAIPAYVAFNWIVGSTVIQLGTLFAEKQILYDRFRGLETLMREVSLARTLSTSQSIRDWANNEDDAELKRRGIAELEHFRQSFADRSYFFVVGSSGNYYFNDAANSYAGSQFRYTVSPDNPRDAWYYATAALGEGCHLNVDNDANLRVTKVWMNCVIREGRRVLGILGTGIDLSSFIQEVVNVPQAGVTSMFVDRQGAIQAHRDENMVDLRSLTAEMSAKRTVFSLIDSPAEQGEMRVLMDQVATENATARSMFMTIGGKRMLVGIGYLDKLGWYNVTLMDIDAIIDRRLFLPIGLLLLVAAGLVAGLMMLMFKRLVLDRLLRLETVVRSARQGDYGPALAMSDEPDDEVGQLSRTFTEMAVAVDDHTRLLEARVRERTVDLQRLAFQDAQTGLANRRGFVDAFAAAGGAAPRGLLLVDIDHFKAVNDTHGHAAGDVVVTEVTRRIVEAGGPLSTCARWGGDEFIVLIEGSAPNLLRAAAYAIMSGVSQGPVRLADGREIAVTVSVGGCLVEAGDAIEAATDMADTALYMAKSDGRNRVVILDRDPSNGQHSQRAG